MTPRLHILLAVAALAAFTAAPAHATAPGGEGRIAYLSPEGAEPGRAALYTAAADGSDRRLLTASGGEARWSADGQTLAWYDSATQFVNVARGDGSEPRQIVNRVTGDFALSPDGGTLVVARTLPRRKGQTSNWIREDLLLVDVATGRERRLAYDGSNAAFSPNGRTIAFVDLSFRAQRARYRGINLIGVNGKGRRQLYGGGNGSDTASLDWSPDGGSIAFTQWVASETETQVRAVGVRSRRVKVIARGTGPFTAWSPTGRRLLTSVWDGSAYNLVSVRAGGGGRTPLGWAGNPVAWQPVPR